MQKINLNLNHAQQVFRSAAKVAANVGYKPRSKHGRSVEAIINGTHLTYKYVLVTALLAKATDNRIHTLALQAGGDLDGAYDARSLCHSVIVPNEKELIDNALGGSNEPYLNKPARFPKIALDNPVRQGKDKRVLQVLHSTLSGIKDSAEALAALQDALAFAVKKRVSETVELEKAVRRQAGGRQQIAVFVANLIAKSIHGETCALATAGLFWLLAMTRREKWTIAVHPVNECGTSSNEVSDVDVKLGSKLIYTAEVKDKVFIAKDVDHAVSKVSKSGFHTLHFIIGPRAELRGATYLHVQSQAAKSGIELFTVTLTSFAESVIPFAPRDLTVKDFAAVIARFAKEARVKEQTIQHLKTILDGME